MPWLASSRSALAAAFFDISVPVRPAFAAPCLAVLSPEPTALPTLSPARVMAFTSSIRASLAGACLSSMCARRACTVRPDGQSLRGDHLQYAPGDPYRAFRWQDDRVAEDNQSTTLTATLRTSQGDIRVNLFPTKAPKTVGNFVGLAEGTQEYSSPNAKGERSGPFYDSVIFHRVIDGFMIQTGDPT